MKSIRICGGTQIVTPFDNIFLKAVLVIGEFNLLKITILEITTRQYL